jgi:hypothetical protein
MSKEEEANQEDWPRHEPQWQRRHDVAQAHAPSPIAPGFSVQSWRRRYWAQVDQLIRLKGRNEVRPLFFAHLQMTITQATPN